MGKKITVDARNRQVRSASNRLLSSASAAAIALLALPGVASAQTDRYWDPNGTAPNRGGSGTWDTSSLLWSPNGDGVSGPYAAWNNANIDNAIFGGPNGTVATVALATPITIHNITVDAGNYTLTGGTLTLAGATPTINTTSTLTINSIVAGNAGLIKTGANVLTLNGTNTFTGDISVTAGSFTVNGDAALGNASNGLTMAGGTRLTSTGVLNSSRVITLSSGTVSLFGTGTGAARFTGAGGISASGVALSNDASDYSGTTVLTGTSTFSSVGNLGQASALGAPTSAAAGMILVTASSGSSGVGRYVGSGGSSNRDWTIQSSGPGGAVLQNSGTGTLTLTGNILTTNSAAANSSVGFQATTADLQLLGVISSALDRITAFAGGGTARTITLAGANTFTGNPVISSVTVKASVLADAGIASSLGTGTGAAGPAITINALGVLDYVGTGDSSNRAFTLSGAAGISNDGSGALTLSGGAAMATGTTLTLGGNYAGVNTLSGVVSGTGNLVMNGGVSSVWLLTGANTFAGANASTPQKITLQGGTLRAGNSQAFGILPDAMVNAGTLDLGGFDVGISSLAGTGGNVALGTNTLTVKGASSTSYTGTITGTGNLTKAGSGTLTLSGANSYTGTTTVSGGTLALNFGSAGAPASNILSGSSSLTMSGGALTVTGTTGQAQSFAGTTIAAGSNTITGAGNTSINLGAISRTSGLVNFVLPTTGAITTTPATVLGGWATVSSGTTTDYAQVDVSGNIIARTAYANKDDASTWLTGDVVSDAGGAANSPYFGTVGSNVQLGGLKYTAAANSTVTVGAGNTLGVDGTIIVSQSVGAQNITLNGGALTGQAGGGILGLLTNSTGNFTINSTIVDNGGAIGFTKAGAGLATLTGANTYTGATTLSGGTLAVSSIGNGGVASGIGASSNASSNLVLESGTLQYTGGTATSDRGFTLVDGGTARTIQISNAATNLTFAGQVTSADGAGLIKSGAGTLTLANAGSDYVGVTAIAGGILSVNTLADGGVNSGIGAATNDSANLSMSGGGTLQYTGAEVTIDRGFTLGGGGGGFDVASAGTTLTVGGTGVGTGALIKNGAGTLVLSGTNTYAGGNLVNAGTLRAGSTQAFGLATSSATTVAAGATIDLNGFSNSLSSVSGAGNVTLGNATLTISNGNGGLFTGTISGTGSLVKGGGGTQQISGCNNNYTGGTSIQGGMLSVDCLANGGLASAIGASSNAPANLAIGTNGQLLYTGSSVTIDRGVTLSSGDGYVNVVAGTTLGFTGQVTGAGRLRKAGAGVLVLSGANNYTGGTVLDGGTLRAGVATNAFGGGAILFTGADAILDLAGFSNNVSSLQSGTAPGAILLGGATLTVTSGGTGPIYSGTISGSGNFVKTGANTQILSGAASDYTGSTTISGGTLQVNKLSDGGAASSIGASTNVPGNLVLNGGTLAYIGTGDSTNRRFTLGSTGGSTLSASGTGAVVFTNTGGLAFSSANINQTVTLNGTNIDNNSLATQITDNGTGRTSLTKAGTGTWILTNAASTYSGVTNISGGVLGVSKLADGGVASSLGASSSAAANLVIGNGSTLRYTGTGDTTNRLFTLSAGTSTIESSGTGAVVFTDTGPVTLAGANQARTISLGGTNSGNNTLAGSIGNAGTGVTTLAKNDSGTWVLTGNNSFTGNTVINDGDLIIGNGGTTGNAGAGNVIVNAPSSTLSFNRSDTFNFTGTLSGPGGIAQIGSGTTVLTASGNAIGSTRIDAGTLQVNGSLTTATTATIAMNGSSALVVNGIVQGTAGNAATLIGGAGASTITVNSGATLAANGDLGDGGDVVALAGTLATGSAVLSLGAGNNILTLNDGGNITGAGVAGGAGTDTLVVNNSTGRTLDGSLLSGFEVLSKQGTGGLTLTGDHNYSAGTTIAAGTLSIGNGGTSGTLAGNVVDNGTLAFNRADALTFAGQITGTGAVAQQGAGVTTLTANNSYTGGTTITGGTLQLGSGGTSGSITGNVANNGTLAFNRADTISFAGTISGTGGLTQAGPGTVILTGANGYAGPTTVPGGTLLVNGNQSSATGATSVASGATLGGFGTIGGEVSIANGGTLAAGSNGVGALAIRGNLALASGAASNFEFGQANVAGGPLNDVVSVGGNLTLGGTLNVTQPAGGTFAPGVYRVFNYAGTLTNNGMTVGSLPSGTAFVQTAVAGQVNLVNTAGLTLNFWDGAAGPKNDGTINGGNGIWKMSDGQNNWTNAGGALNADYAQNSFAIFQGTGGAVTVDNGNGAVQATGLQFASNGYVITGGSLTLTGTQAFIRVGDGSATDAGLVARIDAALTGSAQLIKDLGGTLVLTGTNSYTGGTAVNGGTLGISADTNLGGAAGGLNFNGGILNTTANISSNRNVALAGSGTFDTNNATTLILGGPVNGAGSLIKQGTGVLVLAGSGSYTGGTTVNAGTLQLGNGGTSGSLVGDITNDGSLAVDRSDIVTLAGIVSGSGDLQQIGSGTTILTSASNYAAGTTISAGTLQIGNGGTTGSITGDVVDNAALRFARSDTMTFAGIVSGSGLLDQAGSGTTILTGANSYAGATTVSAGTLLINGDQSLATGLTSVASGATLGGVGTIGGSATFASGATFAPGFAGPGTLAINGNLALSGGAALAYEFGQSNTVGGPLNDLVTVGGNLTLGGTIDAMVTTGGRFDVGVYRVISYAGALTNNGLGIGSMPAGSSVSVQTSVAQQVNLVNSGGLTLNFWDGAAGPKFDNAVSGGDGVWQNSAGNNNWTESTGAINAAFSDAAFAVFSAAAGQVTIDNSLGAVTASGMQFASDGYTLVGQTLTLTGPQSLIRVGDGTTVGQGFTATIDAALTGTTQLVKADLGTLVLTGVNSYSGGTLIDEGTLRISSDANLGDAAGDLAFNGGTLNTAATFASGRDVALAGTGTFSTDAGTTLTLTGVASGAGDLTKSGAGSLVLGGTNSYSGATTVNAGSLFVNGDQSAATGATFVASGATLGGSGTIGGNVLLAGGATLAPGTNAVGTLTVKGDLALSAGTTLAFEFGQANTAGGALNDLVKVGGNLTLAGTINVSVPTGGSFGPGVYRVFDYGGALTDNGLTLGTLPGGSDVAVQTAVAGQVNLVNTGGLALNFWDGAAGPKNDGTINGGNGSWMAGGGHSDWTDANGAVNADYAQNSFAIFQGAAGTVTVDSGNGAVQAAGMQFASDGYVVIGNLLTLSGAQAIIQVGDGSVAGANYTATINANLTGAATLTKTDAGTLVLGGVNSYTGGTAINGGTLRISADANLGDAAGGLSLNDGTLNTTADISSARAVVLGGAGTFLTDPGTTLTLSGNVSGAGGLAKSGAGALVLTGTGSYTGATIVGAGTLLVNGDSTAATGPTTVAYGATLGGTGTIGGSATLASGATLSPGAGGAGTLTIGGNLSLANGSRLAYEFGQAGTAGGPLNDLVNVGGNLVLGGTIDVSVSAGGSFDVGVYRVFNYGGTLTDNGLTLGNLPSASNVTVQTSIAGQVNLVNSAGLTLSFWDGAAGPKNNGVINGGVGTWQNSTGNDNWTDRNGAVNAAYSDGGFAVFGGTAGTVTVDNSLGAVSASGMQFATNGYVIAGDTVALTGPQAVIRVGDGSAAGAGFVATINAALSGSAQLVKTDAGTLVLGGTNSYTGGTAINGGTLQIASDASLGAASGGVSFDGGTLATSATLTSNRTVALAGTGTIATANATTFTLAGALSGTGALTKAGAGTLLLTGDSSGYAGATHVAAGTLAVTGALGGTMTVGSGARLEGTGSVGAVTNFGVVAPGRDSFGTLTMASYAGAGGRLEIRTALGGDASPTDRLVTGTTAGTTTIDVINRGGLGAQTVEGVKIVDVTGASNGTFLLRGDYVFGGEQAVIAGAYGYRLYKGGVSTPTDGDWYLRSSLLATPEQPQVPLYQPGVPVYEAYGQTLLALTDVGTMQQRTGNRQWAATESGKPSGIWGRMQAGRSRPNATVTTSLADVNVDSWKMEIGADHVLSERGDGASLVLGVLGSYGEANANVASLYGNGAIKTKGYGAGATLTWFGPAGFYVDSRAQLTWFDSRLRSAVLGTLADGNHGFGQAYSLEVGKRASIGGKLSVTPQIQMVYQHVGFDRFTDPNDATVSSGRGGSLKSRWGLSVDRQDARSYVYGVANLSYEWLDGMVTDVSGTPIRRENHRLWGELGVGGSALIGNRVTLFTEASANTAINDFGKSYSVKGTAGLRLAF